MANEQQSEWQNNKEMNVKENSSATQEGPITGTEGGQEQSTFDQAQGATEEREFPGGEQDRSGQGQFAGGGQGQGQSSTGAATQQAQDTTGDPGRTPGKAEGSENFEENGNE
jgi:hypothetical protein